MTEEKDWIKEFADKYSYNLENFVLPRVRPFEKERKIRLILATIIATLVAIIAVIIIAALIYLYSTHYTDAQTYNSGYRAFTKYGSKKAILFAILIGTFIWNKLQQHFEYKIKNQIMPILASTFDGFRWFEIADDKFYEDVFDADIFPCKENENIVHAYTDMFQGHCKDVKLEFSQAMYSSNDFNFEGGIIRAKMNKSFSGKTVLRPKKVSCADLIALGLERVILEDPEFNKKFNVYSTDQVEARYLLTPSFMEKLKNISIQFTETNKTFCSLCNDYIYIATGAKGGMFALFGLTKRTDNRKNFRKMFGQIVSVIDLVEYLKLNIRTGL